MSKSPEPYHNFRIEYLLHVRRQSAERYEIAQSHDLTIVYEGEFTYMVDGEPLTVRAGEAYYCPKGMLRDRKACTAPVFYTAINFDYAGGEKPLPLEHCVKHTRSAELDIALRRMIATYGAKEQFWQERSDALLALAVCELLRLNQPVEKPAENPHVTQMKRVILDDLSRRMTVEDIAGRVHLAPSYCSELFKRETGMAISEWALQEHIEAAKRMLSESELSIKEVSEGAGFCDRFYFSRVFHQQTGLSPTDYRRMAKDVGAMPEHRIETRRM